MICMNETMLKENENKTIAGYTAYHRNINPNSRLGSAILVRFGIQHTPFVIKCTTVELLAVRIESTEKPFFVVNCYIPNHTDANLNELFQAILPIKEPIL